LYRADFVLSWFRGVVFAALCCSACGTPLMKLPTGPGGPATDAKDVVADATSACRTVSTLSTEIAASGSIGGHGLRGRLLAGLAPPASARLEAVAPFGQPIFIFVSRGGDATLLLPRDNRVLEHGQSDKVLEAVAGVPLDAAGLRTALTGCATAPDTERAQQFGADWRVVVDGPDQLYLHRESTGGWRIVATVHHAPGAGSGQTSGDWRAEYRDHQNGLPRSVRFVSSDPKRFDLRLALSQVEVNTALGDEVFRVQVPRDADPITLEELRRQGPLAPSPSQTQRTPGTPRTLR
jgi:hypothetical protein